MYDVQHTSGSGLVLQPQGLHKELEMHFWTFKFFTQIDTNISGTIH